MPEAQILGYKFELVSIDAKRKILCLHRLP